MKKARKFKKFEEGGGVESYEDTTAGMKEAYDAQQAAPASDEDLSRGGKEPVAAPKQSFGQAFSAARKGGGKTFDYKGKTYTTDVAESKPAAAPAAVAPKASSAPAPAAAKVSSGRGTMAGTTADDLERYATKKRVQDTIASATKVDKDTDYSQALPVGGPGKVLTSAAKAATPALRRAGEKAAELAGPQLRRYMQERIGMGAPKLPGGAAKALPKPTSNTASRAISETERASAKGIDKIKSEAVNKFKNKPKDIRRGNEEGTEFKRGGTIGKKINGIAQRGKTRGKVC